jgi:hypothetical protein
LNEGRTIAIHRLEQIFEIVRLSSKLKAIKVILAPGICDRGGKRPPVGLVEDPYLPLPSSERKVPQEVPGVVVVFLGFRWHC